MNGRLLNEGIFKQSKGGRRCIRETWFSIYLFWATSQLAQLGVHSWQSSPFQILQKKFLEHQTGATMLDFWIVTLQAKCIRLSSG